MLTESELLAILNSTESACVERTISTKNTEKFCEAICAFANDYPLHRRPGYLIIGANDNGSLAGMQISDEIMLDLAAIRTNGNILPNPAMSIEKFSLPQGEVAVVEVMPSLAPPVRYKGRVWIRVGPSKAVANEQEERVLSERRSAMISTYDVRPVIGANLQEISLRLFEEYREISVDRDTIVANHRSTEEKLASLRCFDLRTSLPTVAGILLFGTNPRYHFPGAYIQFLRFAGNSMEDLPIDQLEVSGDLRTVMETVHNKILAHNLVGMSNQGDFRDKMLPNYPEWALREIFHNAVMHRNYESTSPIRFYWFSDRIEIQSPGGLYGTVTPDTLQKSNSYRNPVLAEAMKTMNYVNRYGFGIQRAEKLLRENGNPPIEFEISDRIFAATIRAIQP